MKTKLASSVYSHLNFFTKQLHSNTSFQKNFQFQRPKFFSSSSNSLPVLDALINKTLSENKNKTLPLQKTAILLVQHTVRTYIPLIKSFIQLGAPKDGIRIVGKHYSECPDVIDAIQEELGVHYHKSSQQVGIGNFHYSFTRDINLFWQDALTAIEQKNAVEKDENNKIDKIIVLDHGGYALACIPAEALKKYLVVGIEKTTAGLINPATQGLPFPIIEVASCDAKIGLESFIIAEEIVEKITPLIPITEKKLTCGVVGYGAIGKAVANKLLSMGHKVIVYDVDQTKLKNTGKAIPTKELTALLGYADYIFGCTGQDITTQIDLFRLCDRNRTLISCSSEDKEFLSLLHFIRKKLNGKASSNPLAEIKYINDLDSTINILRGGFPINFDNRSEIEPKKIQLTRSLILAGVIQATQFFEKADIVRNGGNYMLDPKQQQFIAKEWLKYQQPNDFPQEVIDHFNNEQWIKEKSGGIYLANTNTPDVNDTSNFKEKNPLPYNFAPKLSL